jgi:hypothetical protein
MAVKLDYNTKTATIFKARAQFGSDQCIVCGEALQGGRHFCPKHIDWKIFVPVDPNAEVIGNPDASSSEAR